MREGNKKITKFKMSVEHNLTKKIISVVLSIGADFQDVYLLNAS
jgi:hypothetical protein